VAKGTGGQEAVITQHIIGWTILTLVGLGLFGYTVWGCGWRLAIASWLSAFVISGIILTALRMI
jgi:hypothetical protein